MRDVLYLNMCNFCTCDITFKFTFPIDIINIPAYNSTILLKQFCHLSLSQPHRFILQLHINRRFPVFCLINDNITSIVHEMPPFLCIAPVHCLG